MRVVAAAIFLSLFFLGCQDGNAQEEHAIPLADVLDGTEDGSTGNLVVTPTDTTSDGSTPHDIEPEDLGPSDVAGDEHVDAAADSLDDSPVTPAPSALERLYCELDETLIIGAALRAAECVEGASVAGVLDDAARGFVYGDLVSHGYGSHAFGNCDYLACLSRASDCAEARACDDARWGEPCAVADTYSRCAGDILEVCQWDDEQYRWLQAQDCTRIEGAGCTTDDEGLSTCSTGASPGECPGYYGACDGDLMRRCSFSGTPSPDVVINCAELVEGGTCIETAVGGEAPGPTCSVVDAECTNAFAEGFACDSATGTLHVCLYGRTTAVECQDFGYRTCTDTGFFGARCIQ